MSVANSYQGAVYRGKVATVTTANTTAQYAVTSGTLIYQLEADNTGNTSTTFVKVYDASSGVTHGTQLPVLVFPVPSGTTGTFTFEPVGIECGAGATVCASTVGGTATTAATSPTSAVTVRLVHS